MLISILLIINLLVSATGIYMFDYKVDLMINSPLIIIASILVGTITMVLVFFAYIELFYYTVAIRKPAQSMLMHKLANQVMAVGPFLTNIKVKVVGKENLPKETGFSIYSNHTSMMDIPVLMCNLPNHPVGFLAKDSILKFPAIGKWTPKLGCVFIDRSNDRKAAEAIINVIKNVKKDSTMVVFPEGTRTSVIGKLIDFKPGSFKVAIKSKKPLVPITIVKPLNFKSVKWPFKKKITLVIHPSLAFEDFRKLNSTELAEHVKIIINEPLLTSPIK